MKFIVDSREQNSGVPALLREMAIDFEMAEMAAGDYRICDTLIERKSANDLAASILDGRLFSQIEAMCAVSSKPILLVEGSLASVRNQLHEDALAGAISALALYWDVGFIATADTRGTSRLLGRLWHHSVNGLGYEVPLRVAKVKAQPGAEGAAAVFIVEGLPGVGAETARKLITHFGSARAVFGATEAQLVQCKGIGTKTAAAICAALDSRPVQFRSTKGPAAQL